MAASSASANPFALPILAAAARKHKVLQSHMI